VEANSYGENPVGRAQALVFYALRSTFKWAWDDGLEDWKALLVMSVAMNFAAISVVNVISIALQRRVLLPDTKLLFVILWGTVGVGLVILNHYTLMYGRKWSRFEGEFRHAPKTVRMCAGVAVWVILILCVVTAEWTGSIAWKLPPLGN
jgi:hypothetical protein